MRFGVIVSAGCSERFKSPKILFEVEGRPMLQWVIDLLKRLPLDGRILVVNPHWKSFSKYFNTRGFEILINEDFREGMASSVRKAVEFSKERGAKQVVIFLGDMPFLREETVYKILYFETDKPIIAPLYRGIKGFPTIVKSEVFDEVLKLKGDIGIRKLIRERPDLVQFVKVNDPSVIKDIDEPVDMKQGPLKRASPGGGGGIRTHE